MESLRLAEPGLLEGIEAETPYVVSELAVAGAGQEEAAPVLQLLAGDPASAMEHVRSPARIAFPYSRRMGVAPSSSEIEVLALRPSTRR